MGTGGQQTLQEISGRVSGAQEAKGRAERTEERATSYPTAASLSTHPSDCEKQFLFPRRAGETQPLQPIHPSFHGKEIASDTPIGEEQRQRRAMRHPIKPCLPSPPTVATCWKPQNHKHPQPGLYRPSQAAETLELLDLRSRIAACLQQTALHVIYLCFFSSFFFANRETSIPRAPPKKGLP